MKFERVSYTYTGRPQPALDEFSVAIPAGSSLALVGSSGAGKSTIASLLLRFIEPSSGSILIDRQRLAEIDPAAWRSQVTWVPQRPHLFGGSAAENIRLGYPEASLDEVIAAAQAAAADDFIRALPHGYDTLLGEGGTRLSGGQRQRIAIARAFLKRDAHGATARLLVLDEATAHLDAHSQALVQAALQRLQRGRTVLIIAHRLKLAQTADQIAVIDQGRLVDLGDHENLMRGGGLYYRLYSQAAHGGQTDERRQDG